MALFPCVVGSHRYPGPQQSAYLGLVSGSQSARAKQRLCPSHFQDLRDYLDQTLTLSAIGDVSHLDETDLLPTCQHLGQGDSFDTAYATLYPNKSEPYAYVGAMCASCGVQWSDRFKLA